MVRGEAPGGSLGEEAVAGGMLGRYLGLSGVVREGREGFPLFGGDFSPLCHLP